MVTNPESLRHFLREVQLCYAENDTSLYRLLRSGFDTVGLAHVQRIASKEDFISAVDHDDFDADAIVIDFNFISEEVFDVISRIRNRRIGKSPFIPIIGTVFNVNKDTAARFANCGIDDVLIKPYAPATIVARLKNFALGRKPFIATADYLGPDRRSSEQRKAKKLHALDQQDVKQRRCSVEPAEIIVPNGLKMKADDDFSTKFFQDQAQEAMKQVREEQYRSAVFQICFNISLLGSEIAKTLPGDRIASQLNALNNAIALSKSNAYILKESAPKAEAEAEKIKATIQPMLQSPTPESIASIKSLSQSALNMCIFIYGKDHAEDARVQIHESAMEFLKRLTEEE